MLNPGVLDDLEVGVSRVRIEEHSGPQLMVVKGRFLGIVRSKLGRWFLKISQGGSSYRLVGTSDILCIEEICP